MKSFAIPIFIGVLIVSCQPGAKKESIESKDPEVSLRLQYTPEMEALYSGYVMAKEKDFYFDEYLNVEIIAADSINPLKTFETESSQIGIGSLSQVLKARSVGMPLIVIAQIVHAPDNSFESNGDLIFVKEDFFDENKETLRKFLAATEAGWTYVVNNRQETVEMLMKYNEKLDYATELQKLGEVIELIFSLGVAFGHFDELDYEETKNRMLSGMQETDPSYSTINEISVQSIYRNNW